jgi:hypothetical protein
LTPTPGEIILEILHHKEIVVPSSATTPANPTSKPTARRERAMHYQLEAIVWMSASGRPVGEMAAVTELSEAYITRLMSGKQNKTFNKLLDIYNRKNLKTV